MFVVKKNTFFPGFKFQDDVNSGKRYDRVCEQLTTANLASARVVLTNMDVKLKHVLHILTCEIFDAPFAPPLSRIQPWLGTMQRKEWHDHRSLHEIELTFFSSLTSKDLSSHRQICQVHFYLCLLCFTASVLLRILTIKCHQHLRMPLVSTFVNVTLNGWTAKVADKNN